MLDMLNGINPLFSEPSLKQSCMDSGCEPIVALHMRLTVVFAGYKLRVTFENSSGVDDDFENKISPGPSTKK